VKQKHVVWHGGEIILHTCPVRELDPEADEAVDRMFMTHRLEEGGWTPFALPAAGGLGDQDARVMTGMSIARRVADQIRAEALAERHGYGHTGNA
jgi:hypothetical protein